MTLEEFVDSFYFHGLLRYTARDICRVLGIVPHSFGQFTGYLLWEHLSDEHKAMSLEQFEMMVKMLVAMEGRQR